MENINSTIYLVLRGAHREAARDLQGHEQIQAH
jgi:hypothetical protein